MRYLSCVVDLIQPFEESDMLPIVEKDCSIILDEEKVPQESQALEGTHDVKFKFDEHATDQRSIVHEDKIFDEVAKIDIMVLPMVPKKMVSFAMLILHTNFVIPDEFNDVVEWNTFLFSVLSIVITS